MDNPMSNTATRSNQVRDWFSRTWGGGLILPDGWFGRPHDNIHRLTDVTEDESSLRIVLDEQLSLTFHGNPSVQDNGKELVIVGYSRLAFDWEEYGSNVPHADSYDSGEVKLVAPPSP